MVKRFLSKTFLGLKGNWGSLRLLHGHMAEASMNRTWRETLEKFCEIPMAKKAKLEVQGRRLLLGGSSGLDFVLQAFDTQAV